MINCVTHIDLTLGHHRREQVRWINIHENFVVQSLGSSYYLKYSSMCQCHLGCGKLLLFIWMYTFVINVAQKATELQNLDAKSFVFLWNLLLKNHSSFIQHEHFINSKVFCWIVHFTNFVVQNIKNISYFWTFETPWVITCLRFIIIFNVEESYNVEEAITCHHTACICSSVNHQSLRLLQWSCSVELWCKKYVYFFSCNIRWLCWSIYYVFG